MGSKTFLATAAVAACLVPAAAAARAEAPLAGCYERVYDAAHISSHPGQRVVRLTLLVGPMTDMPPMTVSGVLKIWIAGEKQEFVSHGACVAAEGELTCNGSLSAAEAEGCKTKADGLRNCRINNANPGKFRLAARSGAVLVTVIERLELVQPPFDAGPFLYFNPDNKENHAFLLKPAPASVCK